MPAHTYTVYVTPQGGAETRLAQDFAFRSEQSGVTSLNNFGVWSGLGSHQICNVTVTPIVGSSSSSSVGSSSSSSSVMSSSSSSSSSSVGPITCNYTINSGESINKYSSATAGQTVCVKAGTYSGSLRPANSGSAGNLITFRAFPGDECQGAMGQPKVANSCKVDLTKAVDLGSRNYIRIEGFEIWNTGEAGIYSANGWYASSYNTKGNQIVNNYIHDVQGYDGAIDARNSDGLLAENNEIYNVTGTHAFHVGGELHAKNLTARGNNIHYLGQDGFFGGCDNCLFEHNVLYDSIHTDLHQDGFSLSNVENSIFRYNRIWDFTQLIYFPLKDEAGFHVDGLQIYGNVLFNDNYAEGPGIFIDARRSEASAKNIVIHSNTFGYLGYGAVWIPKSGLGMGTGTVSNVKIFNNIFTNDSGIEVEGTFTSDYNLFHNVNKPSSEGSHSITADPQFVNYQGQHSSNFDLHLKSTSSAIDRGAPNLGSLVTLPSPFLDIDRSQRPMGASYDMGAHEFRQ